MEEGFEGLHTMDLESAGADFDSVTQTSKTITPEPSASSHSTTLPVSPSIPSAIDIARDDTAAEQSFFEPSVFETILQSRESPAMSPLPLALNTPALQSRSNSPPISAAGSCPITPQISPTPSRNDIHGILPTHSHSSGPTEEEDQVMAISSSPAEESRPKSGGGAKAGTKRSGEDANGGRSKKARTSNVDTTTARGGKTRVSVLIQPTSPPVQSIMETQRHSRKGGDVATKQVRIASKDAATRTMGPSGQRRPSRKTVDASAHTAVRSSSDIAPVQAGKNSPPWFSRTLVLLQSESKMGQRWMALVRLWASFEVRSRYEEVKKLAPTNRPTAVTEWIGRGCPSTW